MLKIVGKDGKLEGKGSTSTMNQNKQKESKNIP